MCLYALHCNVEFLVSSSPPKGTRNAGYCVINGGMLWWLEVCRSMPFSDGSCLPIGRVNWGKWCLFKGEVVERCSRPSMLLLINAQLEVNVLHPHAPSGLFYEVNCYEPHSSSLSPPPSSSPWPRTRLGDCLPSNVLVVCLVHQ